MEKANEKYDLDKIKRYNKNKKFILTAHCTSILKFVLAIAIFIVISFAVIGGDVIVENGKLNVDNKLYVDGTGNVGIGTTSPAAKLHIIGGTTGSVSYLASIGGVSAAAGTAVGIAFDPEGNTGRTKGALVYAATGSGWSQGDFHFLQNSVSDASSATLANSVMTIKNSGNVGIGTVGPTGGQLVVKASLDSKTALVVNDNGGNTQSGPTVLIQANVANNPGDPGDGNRALLKLIDSNPAGGNPVASDLIQAFGSIGGVSTNVFTLKRNGNVGIGTTSPSSKLHVIGKATITGGVDPPYISFSNESHESIRQYAKNVEPHEKVMQFWNGDAQRIEVYVIDKDKFYTISGEMLQE